MTTETIPEIVRRFRPLTFPERAAELQRLIGPVDRDPGVMQWRALLVTALNEENLYPAASNVRQP